MLKKSLVFIVLIFNLNLCFPQNVSQLFWNNLQKHCGHAYEGVLSQASENDSFRGKSLVMHLRSCVENKIKIPFFVGDDKSRTRVLTLENGKIKLKHDHRHEDGSEDKIT